MVHGLPFAYDNMMLRDMFKVCGHILNAHVFKDNLGRGKGYGLVCFDNPEVGGCVYWVPNASVIVAAAWHGTRVSRNEQGNG